MFRVEPFSNFDPDTQASRADVCCVHVVLQQDSYSLRMASAGYSALQTTTVLLLAVLMGFSQTLITAEEDDEEELSTAAVGRKPDPMECPSECSCTAEWAVDCAGVDLTKFPTGLSEQTRQLSLQVCDKPRQRIPASRMYTSVHSFWLIYLVFCWQNNKIEKITVEHISHLHQLDTLNLQNNMLTTDGKHTRQYANADCCMGPSSTPCRCRLRRSFIAA